MTDSHFDRNEHGIWCPACGYLLVSAFHMDEVDPPDSCKQCGFPDFEDGTGYFTDDCPTPEDEG